MLSFEKRYFRHTPNGLQRAIFSSLLQERERYNSWWWKKPLYNCFLRGMLLNIFNKFMYLNSQRYRIKPILVEKVMF